MTRRRANRPMSAYIAGTASRKPAMPGPNPVDLLLDRARGFLPRARVPYSGRPEAAVALALDGTLIPGVRVESASFSLAVPAALNAVTTARASGHSVLCAIAWAGRPATPSLGAYIRGLPGTWDPVSDAAWVNREVELPAPGPMLDPFVPAPFVPDPLVPQPFVTAPFLNGTDADRDGIGLARAIAGLAFVPESDFRVGCLLGLPGGLWLPGINVEHPDWNFILCAERNALTTAITFGCGEPNLLYLTCLSDDSGTPCGACRQLLAELAPSCEVVMDRGPQTPERATMDRLLPGAFTGVRLAR